MSVTYPTQADLRDRFLYDADTGLFTWRVQRWRRKQGDVAGAVDSKGHIQISVAGRLFGAHRLAWVYVYGPDVPRILDHINGIKTDNRICNLRPADNFINAQNIRSAPSSNVNSRLLGVTRVTRSESWQARITANGCQRYLGTFPTKEEAHAAYVAAKRELHQGCTI